MHAYPVHYQVSRPQRFARPQLAIRVLAFAALGVLGLPFGMVLLFAYLALPAFAAARIANSADEYLTEDAPRVLRVLEWFAALSAWAGLITERLPMHTPDEYVHVVVEGHPHPSVRSALWRVLNGLPNALALLLAGWVGVFVWLWAALSVLISEKVGPNVFRYLEGLQRWSIRLLAYQASLVDEYPPFSFSEDATTPSMPAVV